MTNESTISADTAILRGRGFVIAHVLAVLASVAVLAALAVQPQWVMTIALFPAIPADWVPSTTMVVSCLLGVLALVIAPRWPAVGLFVFVPLAYGFPRVGYDFRFFLRWHVLEFVSLLAASGYGIWLFRKREKPAWFGHWYVWLLMALMAWIVVTTIVAAARGNYMPAANHHPILMFNAIVMFLLAAESLGTPRNGALLGATLALTLCLRGLLASQWIKGNGDLGVLLSMSIPLTLAGVVTVRLSIWRYLFVLATIVQGMLLYSTTNRGGGVAIIAAGVTVLMLCRCKIKALLLVSPVLILAGAMFIGTDYWQRFADIWQDGYAKKTANSRIDLWIGGWRMALDYPVFGVGLSNFEHRVAEYTPSGRDDSPHNNIVAFLAETGFAGAVLYVAVFANTLCLATTAARRDPDPRRRWFATFLVASLVAYLAGGMFMTRHTLTLAYLLAGGALAVSASIPALPLLLDQPSRR